MKKKLIYCILFLLIIFTIIGVWFVSKHETVAIIGAMDVEIEEILSNLSNVRNKQYSEFKITTGNLGKYRIVLSKSGVGKVASATTTQFIIDKYKPIYVINVGIAGSLSPDLKVGDTVIAEKMVQHDFDITQFGKPRGYIDSETEPDKPTFFYSDKNLIAKFKDSNSVKLGTIATGDIFVSDSKIKHKLREEFGADMADMESAAIAHAARRNNTPVIILRAISDGVKDTENEYKQNKPDIAKIPALMAVKVLKADK